MVFNKTLFQLYSDSQIQDVVIGYTIAITFFYLQL